MAVQAQYPSNVLLLNRNEQEAANDYLVQPQPSGEVGGGGAFLDQSHMVFQNGGDNHRKRGREGPTPTTTVGRGGITKIVTSSSYPPPIHPNKKQSVLNQSQPPQLIDLSQLHHPTPNISTGLHLSSSAGHRPLQLYHHHHQKPQEENFVSSQNLFTQDFASPIKRHGYELHHFLQAQGEELRRTLAEKMKNHYRALISAAEESITRQLNEKEANLGNATRRNAELEARAEQLTLEARAWRAKAQAHEAVATTLQAQLKQALVGATEMTTHDGGGGVEGQAEDAGSAYVDPEMETMGYFGCKSCKKRVARVVVLPCRHLCLCSECDQVVHACPICLRLKNSSLGVFLC